MSFKDNIATKPKPSAPKTKFLDPKAVKTQDLNPKLHIKTPNPTTCIGFSIVAHPHEGSEFKA